MENYEQKYKEALGRANAKIETYNHLGNASAVKSICEIFPELKESEDERIRKALIRNFTNQHSSNFPTADGFTREQILAWLEKQGEKKSDPRYSIIDELIKADDIYQMSMNNAMVEEAKSKAISSLSKLSISELLGFENQGEKKTLSTEETELNSLAFITELGYTCIPPKEENQMMDLWEYIKEFKDKFGRLPKDEDELAACIDYVIKRQKPIDKAEPKFKVGDWIIYNRNDSSREILYVYDIRDGRYYFNDNIHFSWSIKECDEKSHLWTIQDAKDGDILSTENFIFIFKNIDNGNGVHYYCHYEISKHEDDNQFGVALPQSLMGRVGNSITHYSPATKEQRDTLMKAMADARYVWDAEKKELNKIELNSWSEEDNKNLNSVKWIIENSENLNKVFETIGSPEYIKKYFIDWLKSLKPNRWKPSDYDISLLEEIARNIRNNVRLFCSEVSALESLIKNVKTL